MNSMWVGYQTAFTESVIRARGVRCTVKSRAIKPRGKKGGRGVRDDYTNKQVRELPNRI